MKAYKYCLCCLLIALLSACGDKTQDQQQQAERHVKSAQAYLSQGQLRAAVLEAQNVVRLQPDEAKGFILLGKIYNRIGAYTSAQQLLSKVVTDMPDVAAELADAYFYSKKYRSALDVINQYAAVDPNLRLQQLKTMALANIYLGDKEAYKKALERLSTEGGTPEAKAYVQATYEMTQGRPESAQVLLEQVLKQYPDNIDILELQGAMYLYQQKLSEAESYLTKALGLLPQTDMLSAQRMRVLSYLIDTLIQLGRTSEAYTYQKVLADANPESNAAQQRFNEALELYLQGNFVQAENILHELREQFPEDKNTATLLGMVEFQQGDDEKAGDLFDQYIDPETATPTVIMAAALVKYRSNKLDDAIELLKKAAENQPNDAQILATYGLALLDRDERSAEGAKALEKSLAVNPKQQRIRIALAKRYIALEQPQQAIAQLQKAYEEQPLDLAIQQAYFKMLFDQQEVKRVKEEIENFKRNHSDSPRGLFLEGWYEVEQKNFVAAEKAFERALSMPDNNEKQLAYSGLAQIYDMQNNPQKAITAWQHTIEANPASMPPYRSWMRHVIGLNRSEQAEAFLQSLAANSKAWQPALVLADIQARTGRLDAAISAAEAAFGNHPNNQTLKHKLASFYQAKAMNLRSKQQSSDAKNYYLKAINLYPENPGFLVGLIETEISSKNITEAQKLLDEYAKTDAEGALRYYLQGIIYAAENKLPEELKQYRLSWEVQPTETVANAILTYYQKHNPEMAAGFVDEWVEKIPDSQRAIMMKAMAAQNANDKTTAIGFYEKALSKNPESALVLNNLAWLYYEQGDKRAADLARKAAQLAPNSAAVLDTYGWILVETGNVKQGIVLLQKASELAPDDKEIKAHLDQARAKP